MPTVTTFANFAVTNLGPLTTTYTAPASCITEPGRVVVGFSDSPLGREWQTTCGPLAGTIGQCQPSGSVLDAHASSQYPRVSPGFLSYYSPGIACPASWTTAGVTSRNADGSPGNATGAFNLPTPTGTNTDPSFLQWNTALAQVLDPGETAVVCCPSGYTVPPEGGYCYSVLPSSVYQPSAGSSYCQLIFNNTDIGTLSMTLTINGQPRPTQVLEITGSGSLTPESTSFSPSRASQLVGVNIMPMVPLVHKEADLSATSSGGASGGSKNAVGSLRPATFGVWPVTVIAVAMAAGAVLMLPL